MLLGNLNLLLLRTAFFFLAAVRIFVLVLVIRINSELECLLTRHSRLFYRVIFDFAALLAFFGALSLRICIPKLRLANIIPLLLFCLSLRQEITKPGPVRIDHTVLCLLQRLVDAHRDHEVAGANLHLGHKLLGVVKLDMQNIKSYDLIEARQDLPSSSLLEVCLLCSADPSVVMVQDQLAVP